MEAAIFEQCVANTTSRSEKSWVEIPKKVHTRVVSFTSDLLDNELPKDLAENIGWKEFMSFRDAVKNEVAAGRSPTTEHYQMVKKAEYALDTASRYSQKDPWPR